MTAAQELAAYNRRQAAEYQRKNFSGLKDQVQLPERFTGKKTEPESMPLNWTKPQPQQDT